MRLPSAPKPRNYMRCTSRCTAVPRLLGCLQPEDLALLKEEMGERFQVWVARLEGQTIGFHCGMCDGREVEAYFVGFEGGHNKSHALYQRMLVEFIQWGIREGCALVNLGRTALDIKASLGAEPQPVGVARTHA